MKVTIHAGLLYLILSQFTLHASEKPRFLSLVALDNGEMISYEQLLNTNKLTGLSLAVVDNYHIVYTRTAGLKEIGTQRKIDDNTAFSTASISKPVTATIAAMLAQQELLDLDAPVSNYLKRWKMPRSVLTTDRKITFRDLLTHTAGTSQSGFADFYLGDDIPTPIESLNGIKLPRYRKPISIGFAPGTDWRYSGGGYVIVQIALEDITGKSLAQLAEEMLFSPLGMSNTTMYQHGHKKFLNNIAKVHDDEQHVIKTGIPICPQIAPSGMWSTAVDMAKFMIDYQLALAGKKSKVISPWVAKETTKIHTLKKVGGWSAGWMRFEASGNLDWFSHGGSNTGTGGQVMATMKGGRAIIIFGNGSGLARNPSIEALTSSAIKQLGWYRVISSSKKRLNRTFIKKVSGRYLSSFNSIINVKEDNDKFIYKGYLSSWNAAPDGDLIYIGNNKFAVNNFSNEISVERNPQDKKYYLTFTRQGTKLKDYAFRKLNKNEKVPFEIARTEDFNTTLNAYKKWKKTYPQSSMFSINTLHNSGYRELNRSNYLAALNFFKVLTTLYPDNANGFDSLAETYFKKGDKVRARKFYKKSLVLDENNENAKNMLKQLTP